MNTEPVIPDFVYTLWGVTLVVGYLLLPVAVYWLHSLWRAAASIRRYARDSVVAAEGIARGTAGPARVLRCSWHGCHYDVRTGHRVDGQAGRLQVFPVAIEDGRVRVAVNVAPAVSEP